MTRPGRYPPILPFIIEANPFVGPIRPHYDGKTLLQISLTAEKAGDISFFHRRKQTDYFCSPRTMQTLPRFLGNGGINIENGFRSATLSKTCTYRTKPTRRCGNTELIPVLTVSEWKITHGVSVNPAGSRKTRDDYRRVVGIASSWRSSILPARR